MDFEDLFNRLTNTINKYRPAEPEPVIFNSTGDGQSEVVPNRSPRWQRSTKRIVITGLFVLALLCLFFLRNMITPLILSWLMVFYLKPLVYSLCQKKKISYKMSVIIVFIGFLIIALGFLVAGGFSIYGQAENLFELISNSMDDLPGLILNFLGGESSKPGQLFARIIDLPPNLELNQQLQNLLSRTGGSVLSFVQGLSSKIGWFFFIYGFSFFIVWESENKERKMKRVTIPGYEYDIEMGIYHLSLIWRRFLWGQAMMMLLTLAIYTVLFFILRIRYGFVLACAAALTQLIPYVGSMFAWTALGLAALFQGTTIFGMKPMPYAILAVVLAFLIDKFKDGFIQPKFLAETLKVHPAAVLAAALICARIMGFLGIFLAAPLTATMQLLLRYILSKLRDEDPWEGIETVGEPMPLKDYFASYKQKFIEFYDKLLNNKKNLWVRVLGGKKHGSDGF